MKLVYFWNFGFTLKLGNQETTTTAHFRVKRLPSLFSCCCNLSTTGNNNQRCPDDLFLWNLWDMQDGARGPYQEWRRFYVADRWTATKWVQAQRTNISRIIHFHASSLILPTCEWQNERRPHWRDLLSHESPYAKGPRQFTVHMKWGRQPKHLKESSSMLEYTTNSKNQYYSGING